MGSKEGSRGSVEMQLIDMGFDKSLVARAVEKQPTLQRATEWILQNQHSLGARARGARAHLRPTAPACAHPAARARADHNDRKRSRPDGPMSPPPPQPPRKTEAAPAASAEGKVVRILAGPRKGEEARVLHTGNGWVRLQLSDGAQTNLRSWDLEGYDPPPASASRPAAAARPKPSSTPSGGGAAASRPATDEKHVHPLKKRLLAYVPPPEPEPAAAEESAAAAPADGGDALPADEVAAAPPAPPDAGDDDA